MKTYIVPLISVVIVDTDSTMDQLPAISKGFLTEQGPDVSGIEIADGELTGEIDSKRGNLFFFDDDIEDDFGY